MTDHADTIRSTFAYLPTRWRPAGGEWCDKRDAYAALDAFEAERQQAIDALREIVARRRAIDHASEIARAALVKLGEKP